MGRAPSDMVSTPPTKSILAKYDFWVLSIYSTTTILSAYNLPDCIQWCIYDYSEYNFRSAGYQQRLLQRSSFNGGKYTEHHKRHRPSGISSGCYDWCETCNRTRLDVRYMSGVHCDQCRIRLLYGGSSGEDADWKGHRLHDHRRSYRIPDRYNHGSCWESTSQMESSIGNIKRHGHQIACYLSDARISNVE